MKNIVFKNIFQLDIFFFLLIQMILYNVRKQNIIVEVEIL